jgi:hypothetical protein
MMAVLLLLLLELKMLLAWQFLAELLLLLLMLAELLLLRQARLPLLLIGLLSLLQEFQLLLA